jgi:DNA polymerase-3 subunit epsilon
MEATTSTRLAWLDTETTGLEPSQGARVIDICVIVTDAHLATLDEFETQIKLTPIDRAAAHPKALAVNGYTDADWANAPDNSVAIWKRVQEMTKDAVVYGQNPDFDRKFIAAEMNRFGLKPLWDRRLGDTQLLSLRLMHVLNLPNAKLETAYNALGGPAMTAHRARPDVLRAMYLYRKMLVETDGLSPVRVEVAEKVRVAAGLAVAEIEA